jgi:hypothetical protein
MASTNQRYDMSKPMCSYFVAAPSLPPLPPLPLMLLLPRRSATINAAMC